MTKKELKKQKVFKDLSVLKVICCETQTVKEKKNTKTKQHWNNLFEKERRRCCDLCSVWLTIRSLFPSFFGGWRRKKLPFPPPSFCGSWCLGKVGTGRCVEGDGVAGGV